MSVFVPPGDCPNCGEPVPAGAAAYPHCGADERTGWSEETYLDGVELPGEEPDSEDGCTCRRTGARLWLTGVLAVVLALMLSGAWWLLVR